LSEADISDLKEISKVINVDYFVIPFASSGADIKQVRTALGDSGSNIKVLAKIDTIHGIENFEEIITQADGMILCRNEL